MNIARLSACAWVCWTLAADGQTPASPQRLPEEALRLKNAYQQSVERAIQPLQQRYVADLTRLMEQLTKAGRLEEAVAIRTELASVKKGTETTMDFKNTRWTWFDSLDPSNTKKCDMDFLGDGTVKVWWNKTLTWKLEGNTLVIHQGMDGRTWRMDRDPATNEWKTDPKVPGQEARTIHFKQALP